MEISYDMKTKEVSFKFNKYKYKFNIVHFVAYTLCFITGVGNLLDRGCASGVGEIDNNNENKYELAVPTPVSNAMATNAEKTR